MCVMKTEKKGDVGRHYVHIFEQTKQGRSRDGKQSPRELGKEVFWAFKPIIRATLIEAAL